MATLVDFAPKKLVAPSLRYNCHWKLYVPAEAGAVAWKETASCWPGATGSRPSSSRPLPPQGEFNAGFCEARKYMPPSFQFDVPVFKKVMVAVNTWLGVKGDRTLCDRIDEL